MARRVLVLGAYGFIGAEVVRHLLASGHFVTGLGRDRETAARVLPDVPFVVCDLRAMTKPTTWAGHLQGIDAVVNCAGALQDGVQDDLAAVQRDAIAALGVACAGRNVAVVQISAVGVDLAADTSFMRTKAQADAALRTCGARVRILRPGLVIGPGSYGGTGLLRMLAAVPFVLPLALPHVPVQCVGIDDVARAVAQAVAGTLPEGSFDLVEDAPHSLAEVAVETRRWLGFAPARAVLRLPRWLTGAVTRVADGLGHLGWRSPMRGTAMRVLKHGVTGDPGPYRAATGQGMRPLPEIYAPWPALREHRLAARMSLLMPVTLGVLSFFWLLSGLIGLIRLDAAAAVLTAAGWSAGLATASVVVWSLVDVALGAGVLWRRWAPAALLGQIGVSAIYLIGGAAVTPELWSDPLGPMIKILPAMILSLVAHQMLQSR